MRKGETILKFMTFIYNNKHKTTEYTEHYKDLKEEYTEQRIRWTHRQVLKQKTNINKNITYNQ